MTSSPDPRDPVTASSRDRRRLSSDELIAMFVAFLGIGGILAWGLTRTDTGFDLGSLTGAPTATASPNALPTGSASLSAAAGIGGAVPQASGSGGIPFLSPEPSPQTVPTSPNPQVMFPFISQPSPAPVAVSPSPSPNLPTLTPAPATPPPPPVPNATSPTGFSDVPADYWASAYIAELVRRNIIGGFPDGTYQPNKPITRAEFAGIVGKAFDKPKQKQALPFKDIQGEYWAKTAIDESVQSGFMNGYPNGVFQPDQEIPLVQLQTALVTGLGLEPPANPDEVLAKYQDAGTVPQWAKLKAATAAETGLVTNYPSRDKLDPNRVATRADAAALIYQALVKDGRIKPRP
jgi:hypothetical protein